VNRVKYAFLALRETAGGAELRIFLDTANGGTGAGAEAPPVRWVVTIQINRAGTRLSRLGLGTIRADANSFASRGVNSRFRGALRFVGCGSVALRLSAGADQTGVGFQVTVRFLGVRVAA